MTRLLCRNPEPLLLGCLIIFCCGGQGRSQSFRPAADASAGGEGSAAGVLVSRMAANEVAAHKQETRYSYLAEERSTRTGGHLWKEKVVETSDGPLHRLLAIDGRPLSPPEAKAENDRIVELVRHPEEFRRLNAAHTDDESHAAQLLQLLPKAFLLSPDGEENGCIRFAFQPNPAFQPSTYEERAIHAMGGTVAVREPVDRLCSLRARIQHPVEFGYGFLGRIDQGGSFALDRVPVDTNNWKSQHIVVHVVGKILMMKSLVREQETLRTNIQVIPQHLSLAEAAAMSQQ